MRIQCKLAFVFLGVSPFSIWAATHYVWQSSTGQVPPFLTWATAATNIQDAVDAAVAGDEIVVTNGTYATGGRVDPYGETNRVVVDKPLALKSVNGPQTTVIDGGIAIGCVYLTDGLLSAEPTGSNVTVTWQSVAGVNYFLERATSVSPSPLFTPLATGIPGQPGTTSCTDTTATNSGPYFYRVGVRN